MPISGNEPPPRRRGPPKDTGPSIEEAIQQAETRSLDFPATERATYVRAMVKRVHELKAAGRSIHQITEQLPEFKRDHPYLFEMITEHDDYDAYVAKWAPRTGAQPCWPCPFCLTSRHFHQTLYLYRHIRAVHADRGEVQNQHLRLKAISDIACLVWCFQPGGTSCQWEPVLQ